MNSSEKSEQAVPSRDVFLAREDYYSDQPRDVWHFTVVAGQYQSGEWYFLIPDQWADSPATIEHIGARPATDGEPYEITWRDVEPGAEEERYEALCKALWGAIRNLGPEVSA